MLSKIPRSSRQKLGALRLCLRNSSATKLTDYYKVLNLKPTATQEEIKQAYHELSKQYHPDRSSDPKSNKLFVEVNEAFSILGKEQSRREYDANRKLTALGLVGEGFKIHYPKPSSEWDNATMEAYNGEMRRRWTERLNEWARAQGAYELERGISVDPVKDNRPVVSLTSIMDREFRLYTLVASVGGILVSLAFIYNTYRS